MTLCRPGQLEIACPRGCPNLKSEPHYRVTECQINHCRQYNSRATMTRMPSIRNRRERNACWEARSFCPVRSPKPCGPPIVNSMPKKLGKRPNPADIAKAFPPAEAWKGPGKSPPPKGNMRCGSGSGRRPCGRGSDLVRGSVFLDPRAYTGITCGVCVRRVETRKHASDTHVLLLDPGFADRANDRRGEPPRQTAPAEEVTLFGGRSARPLLMSCGGTPTAERDDRIRRGLKADIALKVGPLVLRFRGRRPRAVRCLVVRGRLPLRPAGLGRGRRRGPLPLRRRDAVSPQVLPQVAGARPLPQLVRGQVEPRRRGAGSPRPVVSGGSFRGAFRARAAAEVSSRRRGVIRPVVAHSKGTGSDVDLFVGLITAP
ncbi:hypothetical protein DFJ74DRAFT_138615 [Hyaloraphidium curvatum]|nr:hypothetical protein DFJ74DRAFT_138615 [Hyaloraphidium curvatum]